MARTQFTYEAFAFRQQEKAPIQVAFVADAGEVIQWAGVPRKSDELLTGFQRFRDDNRINQEIVPFFQDPKNSSPTAIIVALRRDSSLGGCTIDPSDIPTGKATRVTLTIEFDKEALATDSVFDAAQAYVDSRLRGSTGDISADDDLADEEEDNEEDDDGEDESLAHLGTTTLQRLADLLRDPLNRENQGFRDAVADYVKPAVLIDGQHRVSAAAKLGLSFLICGLYNATWEEQIFQFTVVNIRPKRIPPAVVTSIAGLSLTRLEQNRLKLRLAQAGVKMNEVAIMSLVAYDGRSPFADRVNMAIGPATTADKLGYGGMKRLAKVWFSASRISLLNIAKQAYDTSSVSAARERWRSDDNLWFDFFCAFWSTIRNACRTNSGTRPKATH